MGQTYSPVYLSHGLARIELLILQLIEVCTHRVHVEFLELLEGVVILVVTEHSTQSSVIVNQAVIKCFAQEVPPFTIAREG